MPTPVGIRRAFVDLPFGQVHYAAAGDPQAPPVLLLHQTPRSWMEYRHVLPLLGRHYFAIAMDTAGFGDSAPVPSPASIESWAGVAAQLLDVLGIGEACVVGHHTGGVIAVELATAFADRVRALVLSSTPFTNLTFRRARAKRPPIDEVRPSADGSHLAALWRKRAPFYPAGRPELLEAFVLDALKASGGMEEGHRVVASYRMEDRIGRIRQPTLILRATEDPFAAPHAAELHERIGHARFVAIAGGMVPLPDQMPQEFADAILGFLDGLA
jgi:pimeloyl-ACP methyl ester carboxylesterase